jgi:hypothetical protein
MSASAPAVRVDRLQLRAVRSPRGRNARWDCLLSDAILTWPLPMIGSGWCVFAGPVLCFWKFIRHPQAQRLRGDVDSYLSARGSRDLVRAAHQELTRAWWESRDNYALFVSQFVIDEASAGDVGAASRCLDALQSIPLLDVTNDVVFLAARLVRDGGIPRQAQVDALHVASSTVHGMDYLLTWNCKHIANASLRRRIEAICKAAGYQPPIICTPFESPKD